MKESIALKKQQLERNIQEAEKTWNRLGSVENYRELIKLAHN